MNLERPVAPDPYSLLPQVPTFTVESAAFTDGSELPDAQAYEGGNTSPALSWSGAPDGTKSFAVSCYDPDAPTPSGFWHWFVIGVPGDTTALPEGAGDSGGGALPSGAIQLANDFGTRDYGGAAPPPGDRPHRYFFAVHALDTDDLGLTADDAPAKASFMMLSHILARGATVATYQV